MLRCNLTKSDESTSFILNVDWVFMRNCVLRYINENAKRSAESIYIFTYIFTFLCLSLLHLVQVKQIVRSKINFYSPNVDKKENSKVSSKFLKPKCDSSNTE